MSLSYSQSVDFPETIAIRLNTASMDDYRLFLKIKSLPRYRIVGHVAEVPREYANMLGVDVAKPAIAAYSPLPSLFDYQRDISRLDIRKKKFADFVGCVAGETVIQGPDGNERIDELSRRGQPIKVWSLDANGRKVEAIATPPFVRGVADLFEFRLASGRSVVVTDRHRFLTPLGWQHAQQLRVGDAIAASSLLSPQTADRDACLRLSEFASCHPPSTEDNDRPTHDEDASHFRKTTQDSQGRCFVYSCRGDVRLHREEAVFLSCPPSQDDALTHTLSPRSDAQACRPGHNHPHQSCGRQSMPDYLTLSGSNCAAGSSCQTAESTPTPRPNSARSVLQSPSHAFLFQQARGFFGQLQDCTSKAVPSGNSLFLDTITSINYIRTDEYYDLHVPIFNNYLANGIWHHNCGYGKSLIMLEYAQYVLDLIGKSRRVLIVSPLMVIKQTVREAKRFYGEDVPLEQVRAKELNPWLHSTGPKIGITNYEAITDDILRGNLCCLILDESAMLKSHYGKWGVRLIELGRGLEFKLCLTGLPAPNDRIEYANHAVFLDQFPTVNSFLARYFVNRGQTNERWELKPHALRPFYSGLSHWSIFMNHPSTYGWVDNADSIPPIQTHIHDVEMTDAQQTAVQQLGGDLYGTAGGIVSRGKLSQIAKGRFQGRDVASLKNDFIKGLCDSWPEESTLIWCRYNQEQEALTKHLGAGSIEGKTPEEERERLILDFQEGRLTRLVSKGKCMGFGLNLQRATRQVFSTLQDSYEEYHQLVKRSNRVGSTLTLNVHLPVLPIERPMIETVLKKAKRVDADTTEQEVLFKENSHAEFA